MGYPLRMVEIKTFLLKPIGYNFSMGWNAWWNRFLIRLQ